MFYNVVKPKLLLFYSRTLKHFMSFAIRIHELIYPGFVISFWALKKTCQPYNLKYFFALGHYRKISRVLFPDSLIWNPDGGDLEKPWITDTAKKSFFHHLELVIQSGGGGVISRHVNASFKITVLLPMNFLRSINLRRVASAKKKSNFCIEMKLKWTDDGRRVDVGCHA